MTFDYFRKRCEIVSLKEIPRSEWNDVKKGFEKEGWKYDWKEKSFLSGSENVTEEVR